MCLKGLETCLHGFFSPLFPGRAVHLLEILGGIALYAEAEEVIRLQDLPHLPSLLRCSSLQLLQLFLREDLQRFIVTTDNE